LIFHKHFVKYCVAEVIKLKTFSVGSLATTPQCNAARPAQGSII